MKNETTATEAKVETIATQQKTETSTQTTEVDYEAQLAEKDAEIAKVTGEKENYRKAYLKKASGKPEEENETPPEDWKEEARRIAREEYLATKEADLKSQRETLIKEQSKKLKEVTLALKNRSQITTTSGQGSNEDRPKVETDSYFSTEQIASLKRKGFDDKKIEELKRNMSKVNQMPK